MNNSMRDKVIAKINDRANEISSLMDEANEVLPKNTDIDGVKVMTTDDTVSILNVNGFWDIINRPNSGRWNYKCLADKVWDGSSTDAETLRHLKSCFDDELECMNNLREVISSYKEENKEVYEFFA